MPKRETIENITLKMERYCAYQERCHYEVREKIRSYGVFGDALEDLVAHLISEGFLNEERFAMAYVSGKFRIKSWGREKIRSALRKRHIGEYLIEKALGQIREEEYENTLHQILAKKMQKMPESDTWTLRNRLYQYAYGRGFESDKILGAIDRLFRGQ